MYLSDPVVRPHLGRSRHLLQPNTRPLTQAEACRLADALRDLAYVAEQVRFGVLTPPANAPLLGDPQRYHEVAWGVELEMAIRPSDEAFLCEALLAYAPAVRRTGRA